MPAKKIAKKTAVAKTAKAVKKTETKTAVAKATGYKGHRPGTIKEKIHLLYDKHGPEKARPMALKLGAAAGTINTSWSQFRKAAGSRAKA